MKEMLDKFMITNGELASSSTASSSTDPEEKGTERISNTSVGNAIEQCLLLMVIYIDRWVPNLNLRSISKYEGRYFRIVECQDGTQRRSTCIRNTVTDDRRFAVPDRYDEDWNICDEFCVWVWDRGSMGQPFVNFMLLGLKQHAVVVYDSAHSFDQYLSDTFKDVGEYSTKQKVAVAYEALHGPYLGCASFKILESHGETLFIRCDGNPEMFNILKPRIWKEKGAPWAIMVDTPQRGLQTGTRLKETSCSRVQNEDDE